MFNSEQFTYGCELEFADVNIKNELPNGCKWNNKDYSIVNSNGIANDPLGITSQFGGEINTIPTRTIDEQLDIIRNIIDNLNPCPVINYKCNLHIHIGVPNLINDIETLKKLFSYAYKLPDDILDIIDPIEKPKREFFESEEAFKGAKKRYKRNLISHRYKPSLKIYNAIMESRMSQEFYNNHTLKSNGKLLHQFTIRHGINIKQLWETNTIEFRHFFGTLNMEEYKSCFIWCKEFLREGLNEQQEPKYILIENPNLIFPKPKRYNHFLATGYDLTNVHTNTRQQASLNIQKLLKEHL